MDNSSEYRGKRYFSLLTNTARYKENMAHIELISDYDSIWLMCDSFFKEIRISDVCPMFYSMYPLFYTNITCFANKQSIQKMWDTCNIKYYNPYTVISFL